jgi:DNA polymerase elongation subunit (family B)
MNSSIDKILFLDIETVPAYPSFDDVPERFRELWSKKSEQLTKGEQTPAEAYARAGIYAEFGKIVCISAGYLARQNGLLAFRAKSFYDDDERALLLAFAGALSAFTQKHRSDLRLCAHNGKEFDFPYIARRMLVHGIALPKALDVQGRKPWETPFLDTMDMWRFGDYKAFTSLNLLAAVFDVPTPKDDIDGSQVADVYYREKNLPRIATYCEKDTRTVARILMKLQGNHEDVLWEA